MSENFNIMKRRSSSLAYPAKLDKSIDISRLSTATCSSKKGASPNSFYKYIYDSSNFRLLSDNSGSNQKSSQSIAGIYRASRKNSITPQQLFTENYPQKRQSSANQCVCKQKNTQNVTIKKQQQIIAPKKVIKGSNTAAKEGQKLKKQPIQIKKQEKLKKQDTLKEKNVLKKKINRLTTQLQEEDERQKENEMNFVASISTIKAKIGIIQHKRSLSESNSQNAHNCARDQLEQKTKEFYDMQQNFQAMYSNMAEKHHQDQVDWSLVYTNLLKDKTNLKKNLTIRSKLK